jgi:RHS repeat-associated protein
MLHTESHLGRALFSALALATTGSVGFAADDHYYVNDPLATTVAITDSAGEIAAMEADAFGAPLPAGEAPGRFTGKPYDADLGAYVFPFRNYRPEEGRWMSADPSGFPDGMNNSIYNQNFTEVDTLGLRSVELLGGPAQTTNMTSGNTVLGVVNKINYKSINSQTHGGAEIVLSPVLNQSASGFFQWRQRITGNYSDGSFVSFDGHDLKNILDPVGRAGPNREWYSNSDEFGKTFTFVPFYDIAQLEWTRLTSSRSWLEVKFSLELVNISSLSVYKGGVTVAEFQWGYKMSKE